MRTKVHFVVSGAGGRSRSPFRLVGDRPDNRSDGQEIADHLSDVAGLDIALGAKRVARDGQDLADKGEDCGLRHVVLEIRYYCWLRVIRPASGSAGVGGGVDRSQASARQGGGTWPRGRRGRRWIGCRRGRGWHGRPDRRRSRQGHPDRVRRSGQHRRSTAGGADCPGLSVPLPCLVNSPNRAP